MDGISISSANVEEVVGSGIIALLDEELLGRYPDEPVNGIVPEEFRASGGYFVAARDVGGIVGCGAFRPYDTETVEIKRMYVSDRFRGRGISRKILGLLEAEARSRGYNRSLLETGDLQPEAIGLYESSGYHEIELYGQFAESEHSVCFAKRL